MEKILDNSTSKFRGQVLNRIYRVWLVRKFLPVFLVEVVVLSVILYQFSKLVFVERVLENFFKIFFQSPSGGLIFLLSSFGKTPLTTKMFTVVIIVLIALLLRVLTQGFLRFVLVRKNYFGKVEQKQK